MSVLRIAVNGARGKMGQTVVDFIKKHNTLKLSATVDRGDDLAQKVKRSNTNVVVDFTHPEIRMETVKNVLFAGAAAVVGTTGFTPKDLETIESWVNETGKGCVIAPNFIIGNVLMQQFVKQAALYYEYAEIIEYHHEQKVDFPSGTAIKTAELMSEKRTKFKCSNDQVANIAGARGGNFNGIKLHAVRMPGFIASQEVILGDIGQYLTIRHDSIERNSYMPGILIASEYISEKAELVYGLEHIL